MLDGAGAAADGRTDGDGKVRGGGPGGGAYAGGYVRGGGPGGAENVGVRMDDVVEGRGWPPDEGMVVVERDDGVEWAEVKVV